MNTLHDVLQNKSKSLEKPRILSENHAQLNSKITTVNHTAFSIEDKVIENKVDLKLVNNIELARARFNNQHLVAVNNLEFMVNGELVLPEAITSLIDNPMYLPRYKKLAKNHGVNYLLKLAELARLNNHYQPNRWFARCCSVENWKEMTLHMLNKLFQKIEKTKEKLATVKINSKYFYYYVKALNKISEWQANRLIELTKARWVNSPPSLLAKETKKLLSAIQ
jgi:hypothetical protein